MEYGEPKFCLITGLRFGGYEDLINTPSSGSPLQFRGRVFPNHMDQQVRLRDLVNYIKGPDFKDLNEDAVLLFQLIILLRGFLGRKFYMCIPPLVYELADHPNRWER